MTYEEHTEIGKLKEIERIEKANIELASKLAEVEVNYENLKERESDHQNQIGKLEVELSKAEKVIDEMAEYLAIIRDCPNEDKGANIDCENRCTNDDNLYAECWKMYFERKVGGKDE